MLCQSWILYPSGEKLGHLPQCFWAFETEKKHFKKDVRFSKPMGSYSTRHFRYPIVSSLPLSPFPVFEVSPHHMRPRYISVQGFLMRSSKGGGKRLFQKWKKNRKALSNCTPWKINMEHVLMEVWKIIFLSKWVICRFHVNLPGCSTHGFFSLVELFVRSCIFPKWRKLRPFFWGGMDVANVDFEQMIAFLFSGHCRLEDWNYFFFFVVLKYYQSPCYGC